MLGQRWRRGKPVEDHVAGEVVQRPGAAGDGEPAVAEVLVIELELADRLGARGVDGGQCQDQPVTLISGSGDGRPISSSASGRMTLRGCSPTEIRDAGVTEDRAVLLAVPEQGPDDGQRVVALVAKELVGNGKDLLAGHLPEVVVSAGPFRQRRGSGGEVGQYRVGSART